MANSGGGIIVAGVAEGDGGVLESVGLERLLDKAALIAGLKTYAPPPLLELVDILDFAFEAAEYQTLIGKKFQVLFIGGDVTHLPFVSRGNGDGIRAGAVYIRRGAASEEATHEELQAIINQRVETGYSSRHEVDLFEHVQQLKILYDSIERRHKKSVVEFLEEQNENQFAWLGSAFRVPAPTPNPAYPREGFDEFIARMIARKKKLIELELAITES